LVARLIKDARGLSRRLGLGGIARRLSIRAGYPAPAKSALEK
jgi:hypothetical protein